MAQKLALLMFVVIGLLAIQTLYLVECSGRDRGRETKDPEPCRRPCSDDRQCGGPCPKCTTGYWTTQVCVK
uniref:Putative 5.3 kDa protein n=1 Tax=Ixodes ricinus TaxID=34613 RepID=A0A0K8RLY7_IXORI